ncbi:hypothetical protein MF271_19305 (plasmid) [Deinococcus sp. KNUC1210]|uniref:hypothetical protein n=1 Tax=Deinococcus sp. KNUC1210 TaxID=2917691 RepID=UPI001EEF9ED1|nr:hypothetical protein [Deinococcus sp. KNUC1210]ULH17339.1 hypothetical protein MF271_19305 [Deinococcus sp. KNUC1210]
MAHQLRASSTWIELPPTTDYDDPEYKPNQEQKQTAGAVQTWVTRGTTPAGARLKMKLTVSATTPQACEDEVERLCAAFQTADAFRDGVGTRFLRINGLPSITRGKFRGRCNRDVQVDWPLLTPFWYDDDTDYTSTRLSP